MSPSGVSHPLAVHAGPAALRLLRDEGLRASDVRMMVGASGGAKWLVLAGLDKAIMRELVPSFTAPVHLLGSSIGAWRFSCYAQEDRLAALARFEYAYLNQTYSDKPDREEITRTSQRILSDVIGVDGANEIATNPVFRLHVMAVRSRHLTASEHPLPLMTGLGAAALANQLSRKTLGAFFSRALISDQRDRPPFYDVDDLPIEHVALTPENVAPAVLASGSIPMVLHGVTPIPGARPGVYRDGGITDYHFDLPLSCDDGLTLYPHFYEQLTPGWFDKRRKSRRPQSHHLDRVLLLAPSAEFVAALPYGKIPDRKDFKGMSQQERLKSWRRVVAESERLGDAFIELVRQGRLAEVAQPLT